MFENLDYAFVLGSLIVFNKYKTCVEIGVAQGHTTDFFCHATKQTGGVVFGFDLWDTHGLWNQFPTFATPAKVNYYLKSKGHNNFILKKVNTKTPRFNELLLKHCPEIDFAFIDGCHSYDGIKNDFEAVYPLLTKDAMVAFHDTAVIDGCREFIIDFRSGEIGKEFDIMDMHFGNGDRCCGLTIAKKRNYNHNIKIDEICGSPSNPEQIYQKETDWINSFK